MKCINTHHNKQLIQEFGSYREVCTSDDSEAICKVTHDLAKWKSNLLVIDTVLNINSLADWWI